MPRPLRDALLLSPGSLGGRELPNRMVMAPMTRCRAGWPGGEPGALMAEYYAQRAGAGLILTEGAWISRQGVEAAFTPGLVTETQERGWRTVTAAVHEAGGRIFAQLGHTGRRSHPRLLEGATPVAPSALAAEASVWVADAPGSAEQLPCPVPRELGVEEIAALVEDYRRAAALALRAGFDGVEINASGGYLLDQFLRSASNRRRDAYGRLPRLLEEVANAVAQQVGPDRTGVRLTPLHARADLACPRSLATCLEVAEHLQSLGLAYLHLAEVDWETVPPVPESFRTELRRAFRGAILVAGGYGRNRAEAILKTGHADFVAFGRPFLANPDLPQRLAEGLPLAELDPETLFTGGARGYTDYPRHPGMEKT